jgi:hypothetical protein
LSQSPGTRWQKQSLRIFQDQGNLGRPKYSNPKDARTGPPSTASASQRVREKGTSEHARLEREAAKNAVTPYILGYNGLPDIDAELEQFAVDPVDPIAGWQIGIFGGTFGRPLRVLDFQRERL